MKLEEINQRDLPLKLRCSSIWTSGIMSEVSPEIEDVLIQADMLHSRALPPRPSMIRSISLRGPIIDPTDRRAPTLDASRRPAMRCDRSCRWVSGAGGPEGQNATGTMYSGSLRFERLAREHDSCQELSGFGDDIGHQAVSSRPILTRDDDGLCYSRVLFEHGLDFAKLDPVASELHLKVRSPQEFEIAVRQDGAQRRRCDTFARRSKTDREGSVRRSVRDAASSRDDTVSTEEQLARLCHRSRGQAAGSRT